jgi:quaternary ammonium compound-resistance protein SugE
MLTMNAWTYVLLAGVFEIGFTTTMKLSNGFERPVYLIPFFICASLSFFCLTKSMEAIPLGTAYAVWTGIGALGTVIVGMVFFNDDVTPARVFLLMMLIGSIIGLKLA